MKKSHRKESGREEVSSIGRRATGLLIVVFFLSIAVNILMLTGPLYMLQVYDRVLASGSKETLVALSLLATFLFLMMGVLDHYRGRIMGRIGAQFQSALDVRVFSAYLTQSATQSGRDAGRSPLKHVEAVQRLLSSQTFLALFDLPWTPLFTAAIFVFHPYLGLLALIGMAILSVTALTNQRMTAGPLARMIGASATADRIAGRLVSDAEVVNALGMRGAAFARWSQARYASLEHSVYHGDRSGFFVVTTKTLRLYLQSAMLGLGAWLVLEGQMTAGAMIAGSILLGRALAPIESVVGQWRTIIEAYRGRHSIIALLEEIAPEIPRTALPPPRGGLIARDVAIMPPGASKATLTGLTFTLSPGTAMGVIGASGSGKTTLARAVTGTWPPRRGRIMLDGASLDQYDSDVLGSHIGYLPQAVSLFDGTIAENISRLAINADPVRIVAAAEKAAAHELILSLPQGYDTLVSRSDGLLSGGQIQRIGLARAMYSDPVILVLDEPNSNLDQEGTAALNRTVSEIKASGGSVIIIAHRPAAIRECDTLLVLADGVMTAFGPRDEILRKMVHNHADIANTSRSNRETMAVVGRVGHGA